ncbi:MAG: hypothetical protein IJ549_07370 [Prevotella sp.]|nr:hypothetical protein [Prevotella sp.]
MKKYFSYLTAFLMIALVSVTLTACSSDDDDEPSLSFTKEIIVGKWKITNIAGNNEHGDWLSVGSEAEFKSDGTCVGWFSMEDSYKIEGGRVKTYYARTNEPMFVYTLLSQNGTTLSVRMDGTLDDNSTCTLTLQKVN